MPLFECGKCGCLENTALTAASWTNLYGGKLMLCSECDHGKWHDRFPKRKVKPEEIEQGLILYIIKDGKHVLNPNAR